MSGHPALLTNIRRLHIRGWGINFSRSNCGDCTFSTRVLAIERLRLVVPPPSQPQGHPQGHPMTPLHDFTMVYQVAITMYVSFSLKHVFLCSLTRAHHSYYIFRKSSKGFHTGCRGHSKSGEGFRTHLFF